MVDKGHCKLLHEGDAFLEYAEFFDYRYLGFILMYTIHRYTVSTKKWSQRIFSIILFRTDEIV